MGRGQGDSGDASLCLFPLMLLLSFILISLSCFSLSGSVTCGSFSSIHFEISLGRLMVQVGGERGLFLFASRFSSL